MVGDAGADLDPWQQHRNIDVVQAFRLLHDVGAREVAFALLQHLHHGHADAIGEHRGCVRGIAAGHVFGHERAPRLHRCVIRPARVGRILQIGRGHHADRFFRPRRLHHRADRDRHVGHEEHRLPLQVIDLADRLGGELGNAGHQEDVGAGALQLGDLGIDRGVGGFVARRLGDDLVPSVPQYVAHAGRIVLTEIVVLIKDAELRVLYMFQHVFRVDLGFGAVVRLPAHGPWILLAVAPLAGPGTDEELRYLVLIHVAGDCRIARRAEVLEAEIDLIFLDELAHVLDGLRRAIAIVE